MRCPDRSHRRAGLVYFGALPISIEYIKAGTLRALPITGAKRSPVLPDIPTVGDFLPGYGASTWFGVGAPKDTPAEIIESFNKEINVGLADPMMQSVSRDSDPFSFVEGAGQRCHTDQRAVAKRIQGLPAVL